MAACGRCGSRRFGRKSVRCLYCLTVGCERCMVVFGDTWLEGGSGRRGAASGTDWAESLVFGDGWGRRDQRQWVCSWDHFDAWAAYYVSHGDAVRRWYHGWALSGVLLDPAAAGRALFLQARHYETAERLEDAARVYEVIGMAKEAGELRRRARTHTVTQVQVDVNHLIEQIRKGGLSTTYTCPACKSPIPITAATTPDALRACKYCGSTIQTTDLVRFLAAVVGV